MFNDKEEQVLNMNKELQVNILINEIPEKIVIISGSALDTISIEFYNKLAGSSSIAIEPERKIARNVNGGIIKTLATTKLGRTTTQKNPMGHIQKPVLVG